MLAVQGNLANTYKSLDGLNRPFSATRRILWNIEAMAKRQHRDTLGAANNYALSLIGLERFEEAKSLLRKTVPVARRVLGRC